MVALGRVTQPMVKFEADDAIATVAAWFKKIKSVKQVIICSLDKDLTQMADGMKVVLWDCRREIVLDEKVWSKNSVSVPNPFLIFWHWLATRQTVTRE
jgi:5'-3' exonuclease